MKKIALQKSALSGTVEAWHCGALSSGHFSLDFLGTGEGINYLGPGIYFASTKDAALIYAKHVGKPFIYKCSFPAESLYDSNRGEPLHLREKIIELNEKLKKDFSVKDINPSSSFKYGKHTIGFLHEKFGRAKAFAILKDIGINGAYENLPGGVIEYCVFDTDIIKILEKSPIEIQDDLPPKLPDIIIAPISKAEVVNIKNIILYAFNEYSYHFFAERTNLINSSEYENFPFIYNFEAADKLAAEIMSEKPDTIILDYNDGSWVIGRAEGNFKKAQLRRNYDYGEGGYMNLDKYKSVEDFRKKRRRKRKQNIKNILDSRPDRYKAKK